MIPRNVSDSSYDSPRKNLEWVVVILSSILLGIWAVKGTIALRNILLVSGALFSIYYVIQEWRYGDLKNQCTIWTLLPVLLLALIFVWVVSHYLFFSIDPVRQFQELKSTWLRAFMASVIGFGTGLALRNHPNRLNLLWLGILIAFLALFYQYIPRALAQKKLLVPDYEYYLFHLKINTVLMGTIFITGVTGAIWDKLRLNSYRWGAFLNWALFYWTISTVIVLWAFVYIVDSRNGIGLYIVMYLFWFLYASIIIIQKKIFSPNRFNFYIVTLGFITLLIILYFAFLQSKLNVGWNSLIQDAKIAVQIDAYPHWQNTAELGYPARADGQTVVSNNYERFARAAAGLRAIGTQPFGVGLLAYPFERYPRPPTKTSLISVSSPIATHSGWIELCLAFGIPMIFMIFSILAITFFKSILYPCRAKMTVLGFVVLITFLYMVGEVTIQHGLEILFYLINLIIGLTFIRSTNISKAL